MLLAKALVNDHDIRPIKGVLDYHGLLFDRHEIIYANRIPAESYHLRAQGVRALTRTHGMSFC